jgi:hypothetical protein
MREGGRGMRLLGAALGRARSLSSDRVFQQVVQQGMEREAE